MLIQVFLAVLSSVATVSATQHFVAYSLRAAQQIVVTSKGKPTKEVFELGGLTSLNGVVYDEQTGDIILVGERDPRRARLTLDDLAVALRARFIHRQWPTVSIDPTEATPRTGRLTVRFEGGIENTQFGKDLFEADFRLKQIALAIVPGGVAGVSSVWDITAAHIRAHPGENNVVMSRFWFYPVLPAVTVRENVASFRGLKVSVFTEVLSGETEGKKVADVSGAHDPASDQFAKLVSDHFTDLAEVHSSFARVQGLNELVALTRAIESLQSPADVDFWLSRYPVERESTKKEIDEIRKEENILGAVNGRMYRQIASGGVQLRALAIRLKAGDITALRQVVLRTRPTPESLTWRFALAGDWIIPGGEAVSGVEAVAELFPHAAFLTEKRRYDEAVGIYDRIAQIAPELLAEAITGKATVLRLKGVAALGSPSGEATVRRALALFQEAIRIKPDCSECRYELGSTMTVLGRTTEAIREFEGAIRVNPKEYLAHYGLGLAYYKLEEDRKAIIHLREYLKYDSSSTFAEQAAALLRKIGGTPPQR